MNPMESPQREEGLFSVAVALPPAERMAFLEKACAGDARLFARIKALVQSREAIGDFLEAPAAIGPADGACAAGAAQAPEEAAGTQIGRYKVLERLGEGGCGVVYLAEQEEPVRRSVALKVIKLGMDTREVIARFEAERQALALMEHPNIAKVLDAGATDAGRPYFVMELVRGVKITEYCDAQSLSTAERLRLFTRVCHAIQHAHQKGVIHRDIKPSNILVTIEDGKPVPKVIDFGIAKATQGRLADQTLYTALEQFMGTPAYMSPEQAEGGIQDIDTRSDIYSLGVLLYELLTGRTPFETNELLRLGLDEMRRCIRETEPPKPSTRLGTLTEADRSTIARLRGAAPAQLSNQVRGDLDWIVMRCLEKNRARRYETADALALDVDHHLSDEPVRARPPSSLYRFGKLVRRNRLAFAAGAAVAGALVAGLGVSTWMYARERAAHERAVVAEENEVRLRRQADGARDEMAAALKRVVAAEAEQSRLSQEAERARNLAVAAEEEQRRQRLEADQARDREARERARAEEAGAGEKRQREQADAARSRAETEARLSKQMARILSDMLRSAGPSVALGRDKALLQEMLGKTAERIHGELAGQPEVAAPLEAMIGETYFDIGDYDRAETELGRAKKELEASEAAGAQSNLAMSGILGGLGNVRAARADYSGAEKLYRDAITRGRAASGEGAMVLAKALDGLAQVHLARGDRAGAEAAQREALDLARKIPGSEGFVAANLITMASMQLARHDTAGARASGGEALALFRKQGPDGRDAAAALITLAAAQQLDRDVSGAVRSLREALEIQKRVEGSDHPELVPTLVLLAINLTEPKDLPTAESYSREAVAIVRKRMGNDSPNTATALDTLAFILERRHKLDEAEAAANESLQILKKAGVNGVELHQPLSTLANIRIDRRDFAGAEAALVEALAAIRVEYGDDHPLVAMKLVAISRLEQFRGNYPKAEAMLLEAYRIQSALKPRVPEFGEQDAKSVDALAQLYEAWAKSDPGKRAQATLWRGRSTEAQNLGTVSDSGPAAEAGSPPYANEKRPDSAVLHDFNGSVTKLFKDAGVTVVRVDGKKLGFGFRGIRAIYVSPGVHSVQVALDGNHGYSVSFAKEAVEAEFKSGRSYRLTAKQVDNDFDLEFWDETDDGGHAVLLRTWRILRNTSLGILNLLQ